MRWLWIDRILELDPGRRIVAVKHVGAAEEHLRGHFPAVAPGPEGPGRAALPVMPATLIIEGVAQAGGILVGHSTGFKENVILAKISRVELDREAVPGDTLRYEVVVERSDRQGAATLGVVTLARPGEEAAPIGRIDLIFGLLDGAAPAPGPVPPAHNFVFGGAFRTLLRDSGFADGAPATPP